MYPYQDKDSINRELTELSNCQLLAYTVIGPIGLSSPNIYIYMFIYIFI